ncbi:hypothetical protein C8Q74DRAFT_1302174 [Fomes fomentarius]|nr:hypothetical protein C8Q74DRAFT_1302174 [Fomes fomentarius]
MSNDSRVWLITGASSGIGLSTTQAALALGERVTATTRKASSSNPLTALLTQYTSSKLLIIEYDPADASFPVSTLLERTASHFGRLDVVVNNAGYAVNGVVEGISDEDARKQLEVNFWAPVRISRDAVRYFREHNSPGRILNVSSTGGFISNPTLAFYSASKFALEGFSEGLNKELDPAWNIRVIAVQPGGVRTQWAQGNMQDLPLPPAYASPDGIATRFRQLIKGNPPMNDSDKVGQALIKLSKEANPPLRLPLGADARYVIQSKINAVQEELDQWKELEISVVADDADPHFFEKLSGTVL